uniref:Uncharacterized protein n=1 Tax=Strombidinopsis acuminata TaxID=141414 RepID=A0A7S3VYP7_9SPIT|mmetsp:Transcript_26561/g.80530  ORF Transcript_26561/g.80530 Transcript_26561/m.80530 type:complete len:102 (+) Transcript_26561:675-980(+)
MFVFEAMGSTNDAGSDALGEVGAGTCSSKILVENSQCSMVPIFAPRIRSDAEAEMQRRETSATLNDPKPVNPVLVRIRDQLRGRSLICGIETKPPSFKHRD